MWIRKTDEEIAETEESHRKSRYQPKWPFLIALGFGGVNTLMHWVGFRGKLEPWGNPMPFGFALVSSLPSFVIAFVIVYAIRLFRRSSPPREGIRLCSTCFEIVAAGAPAHCQCGGELEPIYYWRWQDDL